MKTQMIELASETRQRVYFCYFWDSWKECSKCMNWLTYVPSTIGHQLDISVWLWLS